MGESLKLKEIIMKLPSFEAIKTTACQYSTRIPKAVGFITFSSAGFVMARQCALIAHGCAIEGAKLSLQALKEKSLESANKGILQLGLSFSVCQPQYVPLAAAAVATVACASLAYKHGREFFKPAPPTTPSPRK